MTLSDFNNYLFLWFAASALFVIVWGVHRARDKRKYRDRIMRERINAAIGTPRDFDEVLRKDAEQKTTTNICSICGKRDDVRRFPVRAFGCLRNDCDPTH